MSRKSYYLINKNLEKYAQQIEFGNSTSFGTSKDGVDQHIISCCTNQASSCKALEDREPLRSALSGHASRIPADMHSSTDPSTKRLRLPSKEEQTLERPKRKRVSVEMEQAPSDEECLETSKVPISSTGREMSPSTRKKNGSATSPNACLQKRSHVVRKALAPVSCHFNTNNNLVACTNSQNNDTKLNPILEKLVVLTQQHDILKQQQCRGFDIMMKQLENVRNEQKVINRILAKLDFPVPSDEGNILSKLPFLPVSTMDDLTELEQAIECPEQREFLIHRLSLIGGAKLSNTVNNILRSLLSKSVAIKFSLLGKAEKMAFTDLKLYSCVMEAVRKTSMGQGSSDHDIHRAISLNLIGSRDRSKEHQERQKKHDKKDSTRDKEMTKLLQS